MLDIREFNQRMCRAAQVEVTRGQLLFAPVLFAVLLGYTFCSSSCRVCSAFRTNTEINGIVTGKLIFIKHIDINAFRFLERTI